MPADTLGKQQVRTDANDDVKAQIADGTTPSQLLGVDASGRVSTKMFSGGGTSLGNVGDALKIDIASQGLAGVKVSRDGAAPAAANAIYAELVYGVGPAVVSESNPIPVQIQQDPTPGTVKRGSVDTAYQKDAAVAGNGGSANHNYTVGAGLTLTIREITVSAPGAARFDVILDATGGSPVTIDTFFIPATGGSYTKKYEKNPPTVAATKVFRIVKVNNEKAVASALDLYSSWMGSEA